MSANLSNVLEQLPASDISWDHESWLHCEWKESPLLPVNEEIRVGGIKSFFKTSLSAEWELVVWQADGSFLVFSAPTAAAPTGDYGAFDGSYLKGQSLAAFQ